MKHFFIKGVIWTVIFLCCGCGASDSGSPEGSPSGQMDFGGPQNSQAWQYVDAAMGTVIQMTVYAPEEEAKHFFEEGMGLLTALEQEELSWHLESSEVARINASAGSGAGCRLSGEMASLLEACLTLYKRSDGAFDVTLGPLTKVWNIDQWAADGAADGFQVPSGDVLEQALELCGSDKIQLVYEHPEAEMPAGGAGNQQSMGSEDGVEEDRRTDSVRILMPEGMRLDLGAVGKGLAQSRLTGLLEKEEGLTGAVISLGGSVLVFGEKPDKTPWRVGIIDPFDTSSNVGILALEGQWCISTSGDYERYVEVDGVRYHHILDPDTGYPAAGGVRGVTILAKDGLLSDGLSTACFLLGPERGIRLAEEYEAEVLFVMENGEIIMSEGMEQFFHCNS